MSGVFGKAQAGPVSPENPLGLKGAPEDKANQGEPQNNGADNGNTGQEQQANESQQQAFGQGQEPKVSEGQSTQPEQGVENITVDDDREKKIAFLRQKFDGPEDFEKSTVELAQKLGKQLPESFESQEQLIDYYIQLEEEQGRAAQQQPQSQPGTSNVQNENQQLRQEIEGLRNTVQQLMMQKVQSPQRDPQTGKFISQNQQGQESTEPSLDEIIDNIDLGLDPDESLSDLYEKGFNSKKFKQAVAKTADELVRRRLEEQNKKQQQRQQKQMQAQHLGKLFHQKAESIKQKYGEQEFEKYKPQLAQEFKRYPMYLNPQLFPNGFEMAFENVRRRNNTYQQQQNNMQAQNQNNDAQKKAAKMPGSQGNARFKINQQNLTPEQKIKQQLFQTSENKQGIFG